MYQDNETYEREGEIIVIVLYRSIDSNLRIRISLRGNSIIFCTHNKIKPLPTIESQRLSNYSQIDHFLFILSLSLLITLSIFAFQLPLTSMAVFSQLMSSSNIVYDNTSSITIVYGRQLISIPTDSYSNNFNIIFLMQLHIIQKYFVGNQHPLNLQNIH